MPSKVLVSDTNIWIDLHKAEILEVVFQLPYEFVVTDFVYRELGQPDGAELQQLGLTVLPLEAESIQALFGLRVELNNSSLADVSCYYLASAHDWTLLTGDGALRTAGIRNGMTVHGVLWLLDELEEHALVTPEGLADALESMCRHGARLPVAECERRIRKWREG